jgi:hypothetical protein
VSELETGRMVVVNWSSVARLVGGRSIHIHFAGARDQGLPWPLHSRAVMHSKKHEITDVPQ